MAASSPRGGGANTTYAKLHDGLDHALALVLQGDDAVPEGLGLGNARATSPFEAWLAVRSVAAERQKALTEKKERQRVRAKNKAKRKAEAAQEAAEPPEPELRIVVKPAKKEKIKSENGAPVVKTLDLSGANLSPVMTPAKAPPRNNGVVSPHGRNLPSQAAVDALPPLTTGSPRLDTLGRLRRLPLLEELEPTSAKYRQLVKWLENDNGKNQSLSSDLTSLINKLQKNGTVVPTNGSNGKASPKRMLDVGSETLDDRLNRERKVEKKNGKGTKGGIKRERKQRKTTNTAGRKRKLGGFVVESDEEEYDDGGLAQDSEAEYQSGEDASSSDAEIDYEADADVLPEVTESETDVNKERSQPVRAVNRSSSTSPRKATPPTSTKASPRSTPRPSQSPVAEPSQASLSGKEQLASVAAKLRELDQPTYLTYNVPPVVVVKQELNASASSTPKSKVPLAKEGTSESNAIVLDDSDDEDDEDSTQETTRPTRAASPVAPPPRKAPRSAKQPAASVSPKPPPKQQRAKAPQQATSTTSVAPKAAGKGKAAAPASGKRKNAVESEEDDSDAGEAEFVAAGEDEDSSTEGEEDMFDLNEEDVFVVECILEVKKGRTLLTNSGRYTKDPDLFLVKWEGYDELTWEPETNIPKRIINFFNEREAAKLQCNYQIDKFLQRKVAKNSTTGKEEVLYLIQWKGLPQAYWEVKATLPTKIHVWLEKTSRASLGKATHAGPSSRKKAKS